MAKSFLYKWQLFIVHIQLENYWLFISFVYKFPIKYFDIVSKKEKKYVYLYTFLYRTGSKKCYRLIDTKDWMQFFPLYGYEWLKIRPSPVSCRAMA